MDNDMSLKPQALSDLPLKMLLERFFAFPRVKVHDLSFLNRKVMTRRATLRACSVVVERMIFLTSGTSGPFMLNVVSPSPNNRRVYSGSPAISPHTLTLIPARAPRG